MIHFWGFLLDSPLTNSIWRPQGLGKIGVHLVELWIDLGFGQGLFETLTATVHCQTLNFPWTKPSPIEPKICEYIQHHVLNIQLKFHNFWSSFG